MLKIISLHTIKQIFETEAKIPLSAMAKITYISCLSYWFEDMPADLDSNTGFDVVIAQMKTLNHFTELQAAGLVQINPDTVTFYNVWNRHIDKTLLNKPSPEVYLGLHEQKPANEYEKDLLASRNAFDLLGMRHKLSDKQIEDLMKEFVKEQDAVGNKYYHAGDCISHCLRWVGKKAPTMGKSNVGGGKNVWN